MRPEHPHATGWPEQPPALSARRVIVVIAAVLVLAACAVGVGHAGQPADAAVSQDAGTPGAPPAPGAAPATLATRTTPLGTVATSDGFTVYQFAKDTSNPPASMCSGACAKTWPPVMASDQLALNGVSVAEVGTVTRPDGGVQLTLGGWPVYRYAKDKAPGDTTGQGVGGTWSALGPQRQADQDRASRIRRRARVPRRQHHRRHRLLHHHRARREQQPSAERLERLEPDRRPDQPTRGRRLLAQRQHRLADRRQHRRPDRQPRAPARRAPPPAAATDQHLTRLIRLRHRGPEPPKTQEEGQRRHDPPHRPSTPSLADPATDRLPGRGHRRSPHTPVTFPVRPMLGPDEQPHVPQPCSPQPAPP